MAFIRIQENLVRFKYRQTVHLETFNDIDFLTELQVMLLEDLTNLQICLPYRGVIFEGRPDLNGVGNPSALLRSREMQDFDLHVRWAI